MSEKDSHRGPSSGQGLTLLDVCDTDFAWVSARQSVRRALTALELLQSAHLVIVEEGDGEELYYLLSAEQARFGLGHLRTADVALTSVLASRLDVRPVPALPGETPVDRAPDRCVAESDGRVVGVYDADAPPPDHLRSWWETEPPESQPPFFLNGEMPDLVTVGETITLRAYLSRWPEPETAAQLLKPPEDGPESVTVQVCPRRGLRVRDPAEKALLLGDGEQGRPVSYRLDVLAAGPCAVDLLAYSGGSCLGRVTLAAWAESTASPAAPGGRRSQAALSAPVEETADLTLTVLELEASGPSPRLVFRLSGRDQESRTFGPLPISSDASQRVAALYPDISPPEGHLSADGPNLELRLVQRGAFLWETLVPEGLRRILWSKRDRVRSVLILTDRPPWIPWELCRLQAVENQQVTDGEFLGEAFAVSRWFVEGRAPEELRLDRVALLHDSELAGARDEVTRLAALDGDSIRFETLRMSYEKVMEALVSRRYTALHFSGHGTPPDGPRSRRPYLLLDASNDGLLHLEDLTGSARQFGNRRPLVFLNSCDSARFGSGLTHVGGWARCFLELGAAAFVGTHWPVRSRAAATFAVHLYEGLIAGATLGRAARDARLATRREHPDNSSWLAYSVFAHPRARLVTAPSQSAPETT